METIIGFVAGYIVGSREGKEGAERLRASWQAIRTSPEVRRLAGQAIALAEAAVKQTSGRGLSAVGDKATRAFMERIGAAPRESPHAA